ncbi:MAG TPA: DUF1667 domain-containing protein [Candidatus Limiplasma sp.]|nr:DUF1667 domain-containing protein [Candidatus Limiplasma sp.]
MKTLTCINCPIGCQITVSTDAQGVQHIEGYTCKRGLTYAQTELTNPTRTVTSTVRLHGGPVGQLPVKTDAPIPKGKIKDCMLALKPVAVNAPVQAGDIIVRDVCGTGANIIATRSIPAQ